jgi:hypothetical protein
MLKQTVLLFTAWSFCGLSALAADFPPAYEAVYEQDNAGQKITTTVASDGKGKVKTVGEMSMGKVETGIDYPGKTSTTVMHAQHMWIKQPIKEGFMDEAALKKAAKSLGAKKFNGHPCHGYETTTAGSVSQTWIGDDVHIMVHSETTVGKVKTVSDLKSYSSKPGDVALAIPADCKEFKMPGVQ